MLVQATPDEELGALEPDVPIVLLPVRLETRVLSRQSGWDLGVRMFPDAIHGDAHEPALTQPEQAAGAAFWARPAGERDVAWAELVALLGAQRAAWVAEATRPATGPAQRHRAGALHAAVVDAALPDRFLVSVTADGDDLPLVEGARVRSPLPLGPDPRLLPGRRRRHGRGHALDDRLRHARSTRAWASACRLGASAPKRIDQVLVFGVRASVAPADTTTLLGGLLDAHRYGDGLEVLRVGTPTNAGAAGTPPGARPGPRRRRRRAGARSRRARTARGWRARSASTRSGSRASAVPTRRRGRRAGDADRAVAGHFGYFLRQMLADSVTRRRGDAPARPRGELGARPRSAGAAARRPQPLRRAARRRASPATCPTRATRRRPRAWSSCCAACCPRGTRLPARCRRPGAEAGQGREHRRWPRSSGWRPSASASTRAACTPRVSSTC